MASKLPVPLESQEGDTLVAYLRLRGIAFSHIPNATGHTPEAKRRAVSMKRQGTSKGFPDYVIALPGVGVLYVELKRQRGGGSSVSPEQREWLAVLETCPGAATCLAYGAEEAIAFVQSYLPKHKQENSQTIF
jgi:hypothetical protein